MNIHRCIQSIYPWIREIKPDWITILNVLSNSKPRIHYCIVRWDFPEAGRLKCTTDGSSKGNPGQSSNGFCIRNHRGDLVYAQAGQIGTTTNIEAEARAIHEAIKYCQSQNIQNVSIETDSLVVKNIIKEAWKIPWQIAENIEETKEIMRRLNMIIQHIYREGNVLADYLANITFEDQEVRHFNRFQNFPTMGKRIINTDKAQIQAIRISTRIIQQITREE